MAVQINQAVGNSVNAAGGGNVTVTLTGVVAGSSILVMAFDFGGYPTSCSDPTNGSYGSPVDQVLSSGNDYCSTFVFQNAAAGTYTVTAVSPQNYPYIVAVEIGGAAAISLDGHAISQQPSPGSSTDGLTVGPPSPNNAHTPALVVALMANVYSNGLDVASAGTGYTTYNTVYPWGPGVNAVLVEYKLLSSGTSTAATATSSGGSDPFVSTVAIFDQASSGPGEFHSWDVPAPLRNRPAPKLAADSFFGFDAVAAPSTAHFQTWANETRSSLALNRPSGDVPLTALNRSPSFGVFEAWAGDGSRPPLTAARAFDTYLPTGSLGWAPVEFQAWANDWIPSLRARQPDRGDILSPLVGSGVFSRWLAWSPDGQRAQLAAARSDTTFVADDVAVPATTAWIPWAADGRSPSLAALRFDVPYTGTSLGWAPVGFQTWTNDTRPSWSPKSLEGPAELPSFDVAPFFGEWESWATDARIPRLSPPRPEVPYTGDSLGWAPALWDQWVNDLRPRWSPTPIAAPQHFAPPVTPPTAPVEFQAWATDLPSPRLRGQNEQPPFVGTSLGWAPTRWAQWAIDAASSYRWAKRLEPSQEIPATERAAALSAWISLAPDAPIIRGHASRPDDPQVLAPYDRAPFFAVWAPWVTDPSRQVHFAALPSTDAWLFGAGSEFGANRFSAWANDLPVAHWITRPDSGGFVGAALPPPPPPTGFLEWSSDPHWSRVSYPFSLTQGSPDLFRTSLVPPASVFVTVVQLNGTVEVIQAYPGLIRAVEKLTGN